MCADSITGFKIWYRSQDSFESSQQINVSRNAEQYNVTGLESWKKYTFVIRSLALGHIQSDPRTIQVDVDGKRKYQNTPQLYSSRNITQPDENQ